MSFMSFLSEISSNGKYTRSRDRALRVLRYHGITSEEGKGNTYVPAAGFEEHLRYLVKEQYTPILLSQLVAFVKQKVALPRKPVLITFDKGEHELYTVMYPLLRKYDVKANIFLAASFLGREGYLTLDDIHGMGGGLVEYGLHSYHYGSYALLSPVEMENDIVYSTKLLAAMNIPFQPAIAFPYGDYPKIGRKKEFFFQTLAVHDILLGFRINNRINRLPLADPLLIERIDVNADISLRKFARMAHGTSQWLF